ncbi:MAG: hypothetical protein ACJAWY_003543 [Sphingomonas echinoides]|jgi:hypothetical protein
MTMTTLDIEALRAKVRASNHPRGTPDEVAMWREDLTEARANNAIEGMDLSDEDQALFAMMLDEGLSPAAMVEVIHSLYRTPDGAC